jgi:hypothetical protein
MSRGGLAMEGQGLTLEEVLARQRNASGRRISESSFVTKTFRRFEGTPMTPDCSPNIFGFTAVEGREVVAAFDGGAMSSDAGALVLGTADRSIGLIDRFAACFHDVRCPELVDHAVATMIGQRVFGIAVGYFFSDIHGPGNWLQGR